MKLGLIFAIMAVVLLVGCAQQEVMEDKEIKDSDVMEDKAPPATEPVTEVIEVTPEEDVMEDKPVTTVTVIIEARASVPSEVTITPGSVVVFKHEGKKASMILFRQMDNLKSPRIEPGDTWQVTFPEAGEYKYLDLFNGFVKGTVTVE